MSYFDLLNDGNCNIFTDAAYQKRINIVDNKGGIYNAVSPGANIYDRNLYIIDSMVNIIYNSTVPIGELMGILYGLELGYKYAKPGQVINIFSDSKISVKGLREWVFNWIHNQEGGYLRGYNDSIISNQVYFLGIVYIVLRHNVPVRFYHVRGHLNYNIYKERREFYNSFIRENSLSIPLSDTFMTYLMKGNDIIDSSVKLVLTDINIQQNIQYLSGNPIIREPLDIMSVVNTPGFIQSLDMRRYKKLIRG